MTTKIYARERERAKVGEKQPGYRIVAVTGLDQGLQIHAPHFRRNEIEKIAKDVGAEVIYLEPGDQ